MTSRRSASCFSSQSPLSAEEDQRRVRRSRHAGRRGRECCCLPRGGGWCRSTRAVIVTIAPCGARAIPGWLRRSISECGAWKMQIDDPAVLGALAPEQLRTTARPIFGPMPGRAETGANSGSRRAGRMPQNATNNRALARLTSRFSGVIEPCTHQQEGNAHDRHDTHERRSRSAPPPDTLSLLASRIARDGSRLRPVRRSRDCAALPRPSLTSLRPSWREEDNDLRQVDHRRQAGAGALSDAHVRAHRRLSVRISNSSGRYRTRKPE